jgi:hypothetical protein
VQDLISLDTVVQPVTRATQSTETLAALDARLSAATRGLNHHAIADPANFAGVVRVVGAIRKVMWS